MALITIYAGAILVTYTFVIMLAADAAPAGKRPEDAAKEFLAEFDARSRAPWSAGAVGFLLMGVLLFVIFDRAPQTLLPRLSLTDAKYLTPIEAGARPVSEMGAETAGGELAEGPAAADVGVADVVAEGEVTRGDLYSSNNRNGYSGDVGRGGIQVLGIYLFTRQMVALQIAGLILTVAMVGAIVIARKQVIPDLQPDDMLDAGDGQTMTMPHTPVEDNPHSLLVTATGDPAAEGVPAELNAETGTQNARSGRRRPFIIVPAIQLSAFLIPLFNMPLVHLQHYLAVGGIMFAIGMIGFMSRAEPDRDVPLHGTHVPGRGDLADRLQRVPQQPRGPGVRHLHPRHRRQRGDAGPRHRRAAVPPERDGRFRGVARAEGMMRHET